MIMKHAPHIFASKYKQMQNTKEIDGTQALQVILGNLNIGDILAGLKLKEIISTVLYKRNLEAVIL